MVGVVWGETCRCFAGDVVPGVRVDHRLPDLGGAPTTSYLDHPDYHHPKTSPVLYPTQAIPVNMSGLEKALFNLKVDHIHFVQL